MNRTVKVVPVLTMVLAAGVVFTAAYRLSAQQAATPAPVSAESRAFKPSGSEPLELMVIGVARDLDTKRSYMLTEENRIRTGPR